MLYNIDGKMIAKGGKRMKDEFLCEEAVLDMALARIEEGQECTLENYAELAQEYERLLRKVKKLSLMAEKTEEHYQEQINYDALTKIYNRHFFNQRIGELIYSLGQKQEMMSVLMIDIDVFKAYNDTYGHAQGDKCLYQVAQAIKSCIQEESCFAARYGGEEFAVVYPYATSDKACALAEEILQAVYARKIPHIASQVAEYVTVSVGITSGPVKDMQAHHQYIKTADKALYISKNNGRNQSTYLPLEYRAD